MIRASLVTCMSVGYEPNTLPYLSRCLFGDVLCVTACVREREMFSR